MSLALSTRLETSGGITDSNGAVVFSTYEFLFHLAGFFAGFLLLRRLVGAAGGAWLGAYLLVISGWVYAWRGWADLAVLAASIVVNHELGRRLARAVAGEAGKRWGLRAGVGLNLAALGWFKYRGLLVWPTGAEGAEAWFLPLGISFFTFQQIGFLVDCAAGRTRPLGWVNYAGFVSFFPQLVAGPIVRHDELAPQLARAGSGWTLDLVGRGAALFAFGLAKKTVLADGLAPFVAAGFAAGGNLTSPEAWTVAVAYACQLYFDFSGYCDMAVGLGLMFGIRLPVNFNSPYQATHLAEFWQRWNLTLGAFFRDYLFRPMGGFGRNAQRRGVVLMLTMTLVGLWHGNTWAFAAWGAMHGLGILVVRAWRGFGVRLPKPVAMALTFGYVTFSLIFFRASTWSEAISLYSVMLDGQWSWPHFLPGVPEWAGPRTVWFENVDPRDKDWHLGLLAVALPLVFLARNTNEVLRVQRPGTWLAVRAGLAGAIGVIGISGGKEFIYFVF